MPRFRHFVWVGVHGTPESGGTHTAESAPLSIFEHLSLSLSLPLSPLSTPRRSGSLNPPSTKAFSSARTKPTPPVCTTPTLLFPFHAQTHIRFNPDPTLLTEHPPYPRHHPQHVVNVFAHSSHVCTPPRLPPCAGSHCEFAPLTCWRPHSQFNAVGPIDGLMGMRDVDFGKLMLILCIDFPSAGHLPPFRSVCCRLRT